VRVLRSPCYIGLHQEMEQEVATNSRHCTHPPATPTSRTRPGRDSPSTRAGGHGRGFEIALDMLQALVRRCHAMASCRTSLRGNQQRGRALRFPTPDLVQFYDWMWHCCRPEFTDGMGHSAAQYRAGSIQGGAGAGWGRRWLGAVWGAGHWSARRHPELML